MRTGSIAFFAMDREVSLSLLTGSPLYDYQICSWLISILFLISNLIFLILYP